MIYSHIDVSNREFSKERSFIHACHRPVSPQRSGGSESLFPLQSVREESNTFEYRCQVSVGGGAPAVHYVLYCTVLYCVGVTSLYVQL